MQAKVSNPDVTRVEYFDKEYKVVDYPTLDKKEAISLFNNDFPKVKHTRVWKTNSGNAHNVKKLKEYHSEYIDNLLKNRATRLAERTVTDEVFSEY